MKRDEAAPLSVEGAERRTFELGPPISPALSARWFQALYETPLLFSGILDDQGRVLDANHLSIEGCGLARDQVLGRPFWDCGWWSPSEEVSNQVRRWCWQALTTGEPIRTTSPYFTGDGTRRVVDLALHPVRDHDEGMPYLVATGSDITDAIAAQTDREQRLTSEGVAARRVAESRAMDLEVLKATEQRLAKALQLTEKVLDNVGDGIYGLDVDGRVEFVNEAASKITGYSQAEQIGGDQHHLIHSRRPDGSPYPRSDCPTFRAMQTGRIVTGPHEVFWRADGSPLPVELIAVPTFDSARRVGGVVVSFRDLTERMAAQQQAEQLRRLAAQEAAQRELADRLQQALLTPPPESEDLQVVVRYLPAAHEAQVGGDWYDAFVQPDGALMLVIGDVVGHDAAAAAAMGQLRGLLRGTAWTGSDGPAAALTRLEHAARGLAVETLATVLLGRLESAGGGHASATKTLRWSNAGHLPPLLLNPDGTSVLLDSEPELLLGIDPDTVRHDQQVPLPAGCTLLLFTDGLIERRAAALDDGLERLRGALADLGDAPLETLCDQLLARMVPNGAEDDVAILVVRSR